MITTLSGLISAIRQYYLEILLWNVIGLVSVIVLISPKKWPRNWAEVKREASRQYRMINSIFDGFYLLTTDKIELFPQRGRVALITGGNRGIGASVVKKLIGCEMTVIMGVRDPEAARETMSQRITIPENANYRIDYLLLDIGNIESIRNFALTVQRKYPKIDILINNAGIQAVPFRLNADGFESHFAVNYLGHFLLTHLLMPQLRNAGNKSRNARIINISSSAHFSGDIDMDDINGTVNYCPIKAYCQSKLALVLFSNHLQAIIDKDNYNVQVHSVSPGIVDTDHYKNFVIYHISSMRKLSFKTPEEGARSIVYAAISKEIENKGGTYISHCSALNSSTLSKDKRKQEAFFDFTCSLLKIQKFGQFITKKNSKKRFNTSRS